MRSKTERNPTKLVQGPLKHNKTLWHASEQGRNNVADGHKYETFTFAPKLGETQQKLVEAHSNTMKHCCAHKVKKRVADSNRNS